MPIPKILHQTWKDCNIPEGFARLSATWKKYHPEWEYRLWTDDMNREFVATHFPGFIERYNAYPANIQRVDAVRYLILLKYGGAFVDMDFECCKNVEPLLKEAGCVFGKEPLEHCLVHGKEAIISNAFMAVAPGHPFFNSILDELLDFNERIDHPNDRILETTGPFMLTRVYNRYSSREEISILDSSLIYPLTKSRIETYLAKKKESGQVAEMPSSAYAIHYYCGTWWNTNATIGIETL